MSSASQDVGVRWQGPADAHGESVACERHSPLRPHAHMHWPQAAVVDVRETRLVAEIEGKVVGRAIIDALYPPFGELVNMHVIPAFRGRGAGGALVDQCVHCMAQMGFMAVFLQTHVGYTPALRLYARKGFLLAARGTMLRLVRFLNLPLLDWFLYCHPLAVYSASAGREPQEWQLAWSDWPTGDSLVVTLTGGSCDKDSDEFGPGVKAMSLSTAGLRFEASLSGPRESGKGKQMAVGFSMSNAGDQPLDMAARLLLPPGCNPAGEWQKRGPAGPIEPGQEFRADFQIAFDAGLDLQPLSYSSWLSLPLTVEVLLGQTSFWLTHTVMMGGVRELVPERDRGARSLSRQEL